jgi:uncharacterized protein (TIGR02145 family)
MKNKTKSENRSTDLGVTNFPKSVKIGTQIWTLENLNVDKFRNGDPVPEAKSNKEWEKAGEEGKPAWCYYDNDPSNGGIYGKLYNWFAVNDPRGLAPTGWHVPSDEEWTTLTFYLGGEKAGTKMKANNKWYYYLLLEGEKIEEEETPETNESGFMALPSGIISEIGKFCLIGSFTGWWSTTECSKEDALAIVVQQVHDEVNSFENSKQSGWSVRCLQD